MGTPVVDMDEIQVAAVLKLALPARNATVVLALRLNVTSKGMATG